MSSDRYVLILLCTSPSSMAFNKFCEGLPLSETDLTTQEELKLSIRKWVLQRSMLSDTGGPSLEAAPKSRSQLPHRTGKKDTAQQKGDTNDDLYDF
jgi:hypothetical protein